MGVFLLRQPCCHHRGGLPHARGGVSICQLHGLYAKPSSPRPWGCFSAAILKRRYAQVFPTPVGVFPYKKMMAHTMPRLPHARGGVSGGTTSFGTYCSSSPRPWGCFHPSRRCARSCSVFPTPVGVFLRAGRKSHTRRSLPHARGGVSHLEPMPDDDAVSSPRPWGCFSRAPVRLLWRSVFPTPVGVFPVGGHVYDPVASLPHARGGVSTAAWTKKVYFGSSPRPWGCFPLWSYQNSLLTVFPTPVGVFPT